VGTKGFKRALLSTLIIALLMSLLLISAKAAWGQDIELVRQFGSSEGGNVFKVEPEPAKGFYWAYYLYVPSSIADRANGKTYLLVEPNNTGFSSDDQSIHDESARQLIEWRLSIAENLKVPLLVPTFPRPRKYWQIYTHALDRDTILTEIDELKRIDLQLIAMIDNAIETLSLEGINVEDKVLMMGFSASGMFVDRFTFLHPERVRAAAIGAPGGWPIAPLEEWDGVKLRYPIGVEDMKELVGKEFNIEAVKSIPLYFYMGDKDTNDSVPYRDGYDEEDEQLIFQYFGDTPIKRWPIMENMYESVGCDSQFVLYPGVGHNPDEMSDDVKTFFLEQIAKVEPTPSAPTDYTPYLVGGAVAIVMIGIVAALYMRRRKPTEFRW